MSQIRRGGRQEVACSCLPPLLYQHSQVERTRTKPKALAFYLPERLLGSAELLFARTALTGYHTVDAGAKQGAGEPTQQAYHSEPHRGSEFFLQERDSSQNANLTCLRACDIVAPYLGRPCVCAQRKRIWTTDWGSRGDDLRSSTSRLLARLFFPIAKRPLSFFTKRFLAACAQITFRQSWISLLNSNHFMSPCILTGQKF